eukprot:6193074-Pleurochrysis_carterae.AAC.11
MVRRCLSAYHLGVWLAVVEVEHVGRDGILGEEEGSVAGEVDLHRLDDARALGLDRPVERRAPRLVAQRERGPVLQQLPHALEMTVGGSHLRMAGGDR